MSELLKSAKLIVLPPKKRLCKEGDDADCMYFVSQGDLVATYTLAATDKHAQYFGRKNKNSNADGLIKVISDVNMIKDVSIRLIDEVEKET